MQSGSRRSRYGSDGDPDSGEFPAYGRGVDVERAGNYGEGVAAAVLEGRFAHVVVASLTSWSLSSRRFTRRGTPRSSRWAMTVVR